MYILPHPVGYTLLNTDHDSYPNLRDTDDDGDEIPTLRENYGCIQYDTQGRALWKWYHDHDNDGIPNFLDKDSDNDGVSDKEEWRGDDDRDAMHNSADTDDDNDGIPTKQEDRNNDGNPTNDDTDWDGLPDYLDPNDRRDDVKDTDWDGIPDYIECPLGVGKCPDTDWDGITDDKDLDSDNDLVPDSIEKWPDGRHPQDTDWDGRPDYIDTDDDNDGIPTKQEDRNNDGNPTNDDTDWDGLPDYLDLYDFKSCSTRWWVVLQHNQTMSAYVDDAVYAPTTCRKTTLTCQNGELLWDTSSYPYASCYVIYASCRGPDGDMTPHGAYKTYYMYDKVIGQQWDGDDLCPRQTRKCTNGLRYTMGWFRMDFSYNYRQCLVVAPD